MQYCIYHNPRCSKSREALRLLQEAGQHPELRLYLEQPPSSEELAALLNKLGLNARDILRKKEAAFNELALAEKLDDTAALLTAIQQHPILLERPIVVLGEKACIARPPTRALELQERTAGD